jgi:glutathione S-transferase
VDELSRSGLFQGLIDAAFISVIERRRPEGRQWNEWVDRQHRAITRTLAFTKTPPDGRFDLADISLACGLAYLDFRLSSLVWRSQYPNLAGWLDGVLNRPSMASTSP